MAHVSIGCNSCRSTDFEGLRWKCCQCVNLDLCTACYTAGQHDFTHPFIRYSDTPGSAGVMMPPRKDLINRASAGLFSGENEQMGTNWLHDEQQEHGTVTCAVCREHPLRGIRWKCSQFQCDNYDLCTDCYLAGKHDLSHPFIQIESPESERVTVPSRKELINLLSVTLSEEQEVAVHPTVTCDACQERGIRGLRWKCSQCDDYDLCTDCYLTGKHDLSHPFMLIESAGSERVLLSPRIDDLNFQSLSLVDDEAAVHPTVFCDICDENPLRGVRWKCNECHNYDLCNDCYLAGRHNISHPFIKIESPESDRILVPPRNDDLNIHSPSLADDKEPDIDWESDGEHIQHLQKRVQEMKDAHQCAICLNKQRSIIFTCGHGTCATCAKPLKNCHICRKVISQKIKMF